MFKLSTSYQILLLIALVLLVFYPTQFADVNLIDDYQALGSVLSSDQPSLMEIFFPRSSGGGYYRPLIGISYWLDKYLWFLDERLLHFESVIAHLVNSVLVFLICRVGRSRYKIRSTSLLPLAAALLFAVHPLVTESVNWISGRTDIMMGTFVLISALCMLVYKQQGSILLLLASLVALLLSLLAKETAFGYLLMLPLFLFQNVSGTSDTQIDFNREILLLLSYYMTACCAALFIGNYWLVLLIGCVYFVHLIKIEKIESGGIVHLFKNAWIQVVFLVISVGLFLLLRRLVFTSSVAKIGQTVTLMCADINYTISLFLGAFGFYIKKFFLPLPLNFYIHEIDPLYDFVGIAVFLLTLRLLLSRSIASLFVLSGLALLLPALPFAFGTIAWNSYAERYMYLSTAFWVVAGCMWGTVWLCNCRAHQKSISLAVTVLILLMSLITFQRNRVWQSNVTLFRDTLSHNPSNRMLRSIYMSALGRAGHIEEAKREYQLLKPKDGTLDISLDLAIGDLLIEAGLEREAFSVYKNAYISSSKDTEKLLIAFDRLLARMNENHSGDIREQVEYGEFAIEITSRLQNITKDPRCLFKYGRAALERGSFDEAVSYFDKTLINITSDNNLYPVAIHLRNQARNHVLR